VVFDATVVVSALLFTSDRVAWLRAIGVQEMPWHWLLAPPLRGSPGTAIFKLPFTQGMNIASQRG
jgi:hypothetical protein